MAPGCLPSVPLHSRARGDIAHDCLGVSGAAAGPGVAVWALDVSFALLRKLRRRLGLTGRRGVYVLMPVVLLSLGKRAQGTVRMAGTWMRRRRETLAVIWDGCFLVSAADGVLEGFVVGF